MLAISVKNPYEGEVKFGRDGLPTTHKSGHGIGLGSVAATVKRYDGSIDIEADNGVFSVSILMYAPAE
jgi:sensor histidine kinase regulating citrate/malate metabolism